MKKGIGVPILLMVTLICTAATDGKDTPVGPEGVVLQARPLPLECVRLTGGPLKEAQEQDAKYLLELEPDRMLAYLRQSAGLKPKAEGYGGWDADGRQLTGHIAGHYLSGVSLMWAATGDSRFKERADYIVGELKEIQDKQGDGYIGAQKDRQGVAGKVRFQDLDKGIINASSFDLNGLWSPWYVEHKIFAGLRDDYRYTGNRTALDVEIKLAAWAGSILAKLDDSQIQKMLVAEFGGMNEVLADLYKDTGDRRWLALSDKFEHRAVIDPLAKQQDILPHKHINMLVAKLLGSLVRYTYTGDETDGTAAKFYWDSAVLHHTWATGGEGNNEYFGSPDSSMGMVDGRSSESCNVYNMIKYARELFAIEPAVRYADYHERALFNHVLASMDLNDGRTCYMVPVGLGKQHEYQDMYRSFTCCVGSGMESHALHGYGIYYESGNKLWVNLYAPSIVDWRTAGVRLEMSTDFPEGESASLKLTPGSAKKFTLALRRPYWAGAGFKVNVNGAEIKSLPAPGSYVELTRTWKDGDTVALVLPKRLHLESLPDNPQRVALMWGPLVLAGDLGPEQRGRRTTEQAARPEMPALVTADRNVEKWLKPVYGKPGVFHAPGVSQPRDVEFIPFYRLPARTYGIYWNLFTPAEWRADQEKPKKLEAATVAYLQPGQAQTESDFNQQGEDSTIAQVQGRSGRRSTKWFSYDMAVDPAHPMAVVVTYSNDERQQKRTFDILVDGKKVGEQAIDRRPTEVDASFFDVTYSVPAELVKNKQKVTVRFESSNGTGVSPIFGVRTVRADSLQ